MQSFIFFIVSLLFNIFTLSHSVPCDETVCQLPDCFCAGTSIPGQLTPANTPQFFLLNSIDNVNIMTIDYYRGLLKNRTNPNGCPISATISISHPYVNYEFVHELHADGHEIVMNSITGKLNNLSLETFNLQYADQKLLVSKFAKIPQSDIKGMRAIGFQTIGHNQLEMMKNNFVYSYDSLCGILNQNKSQGWWPFTTEYSQSNTCVVNLEESYSDIWVIPANNWEDQNGSACSMVDSCVNVPNTSDGLLNWMISEFNKKYTGNRAPFGFYTHPGWFLADETRYHATKRFLDYLGTLKDVFIVSGSQVIDWVKHPKTVSEMMTQPITCHKTYVPNCTPLTCLLLTNAGLESYFTHCDTKCPNSYPDIGNPLGKK
ncbi:chitin deacetylase 8-like [Arctopsyche grandis]|uniref:chitin deacetylase 8-like n=1 Tax=Arctopsyche grandis TaxID=121162 RepID=UPI00406D952F